MEEGKGERWIGWVCVEADKERSPLKSQSVPTDSRSQNFKQRDPP